MKVLHIGCGTSPVHELFRGWEEIRMDLNPDCKPDILGPMTDIPLEDGAVDAIWTSHTLEHVYLHEGLQAIREFRRVLKPEGQAWVVVPNLRACLEAIAKGSLYDTLYDTSGGAVSAIDMLYGHQGWIAKDDKPYRWAHRMGYVKETLAQALHEGGFDTVRVGEVDYDLVAVAF